MNGSGTRAGRGALALALLCAAGCGAANDGGPMAMGTGGAPGTVPGAAATGTGTGGLGGGQVSGPGPTLGTGGVGGAAGTGAAGVGPLLGTGGTGGGAGVAGTAMAGTGGVAAMAGAGGGGSGGASGGGAGTCCASGDCLCHGPDPTQLSSSSGPYNTAMYTISTGTVYYPTDADPPLAAVAIIPGFLNTGPEMAPWGPFYASWGIVLADTNSGAADTPDIRATELLAAVDELKTENTNSSSPLYGKLGDRFGTSGYSMGGGGTTIAASMDSTLKTSVGLAPWGGVGQGVAVPTLLLCGDADTVAPCNMAMSDYTSMADSTQKMLMVAPGATHFNWFDPADAGGGMSGKYALAFQKVFLEGDERWKPLLLTPPSGGGMQTTNIK